MSSDNNNNNDAHDDRELPTTCGGRGASRLPPMVVATAIQELVSRCDYRAVVLLVEKYPCVAEARVFALKWRLDKYHDYSEVHYRASKVYLLAVLCDQNAPLNVVEAVYRANPAAVSIQDEHFCFLPLHHACDKARKHCKVNPDVVLFLLAQHPKGAQVTLSFGNGDLPLHLAVFSGAPLQVVRELVDAFPHAVSRQYWKGHTPLHLALLSRRCDWRQTELPRGARAASTPYPDLTRWGYQARCVDLSVVSFLLWKHPLAAQIPEHYGKLPLHLAVYAGAPFCVIQQLLDAYPKAAALADRDGMTPLHLAACYPSTLDVVKCLYHAHPPSAMYVDDGARTPLHWACAKRGADHVVEFLASVAPQAIVLKQDAAGGPGWYRTPAQLAACHQSVQGLQALVDASAAANVSPSPLQQEALLHAACEHNDLDMVEFLCRRYPSRLARRKYSRTGTAVHCALRSGCHVDAHIKALCEFYPDLVEKSCLQMEGALRDPLCSQRLRQALAKTAAQEKRRDRILALCGFAPAASDDTVDACHIC